jgi:hypothetical protein
MYVVVGEMKDITVWLIVVYYESINREALQIISDVARSQIISPEDSASLHMGRCRGRQ